jgi:uncharacterized damage-inducible protein DinB
VSADLHAHLLTQARYHAWATQRLLDALAPLSDEAYRRDMGLFFHSVHGTLNHLIVGERHLWWRRFTEGLSPRVTLDAEVEPERERVAQTMGDAARAWSPWVAGLDTARLTGTLDYITTRGQPVSLPFSATLAHVFNHATHHRGQVSAALTALGGPAPELDLVYSLQAEAKR